MAVNDLSDIVAWKNTMPLGTPSLHVTGTVMAPTPCHEPYLVHTGDSKSNPPTYLLRLDYQVRPGNCIQVVTPKSFSYTENNYSGRHEMVEVTSPSGATGTAPIKTVS